MTTLQKTFLWKRRALHKVKDYQPFGMVGHSSSACLVPSAIPFDDLFVQIPPQQKLCTPTCSAVSVNIVEARYTNSLCMFAVCTHDSCQRADTADQQKADEAQVSHRQILSSCRSRRSLLSAASLAQAQCLQGACLSATRIVLPVYGSFCAANCIL